MESSDATNESGKTRSTPDTSIENGSPPPLRPRLRLGAHPLARPLCAARSARLRLSSAVLVAPITSTPRSPGPEGALHSALLTPPVQPAVPHAGLRARLRAALFADACCQPDVSRRIVHPSARRSPHHQALLERKDELRALRHTRGHAHHFPQLRMLPPSCGTPG
jgi:hypothetical protein